MLDARRVQELRRLLAQDLPIDAAEQRHLADRVAHGDVDGRRLLAVAHHVLALAQLGDLPEVLHRRHRRVDQQHAERVVRLRLELRERLGHPLDRPVSERVDVEVPDPLVPERAQRVGDVLLGLVVGNALAGRPLADAAAGVAARRREERRAGLDRAVDPELHRAEAEVGGQAAGCARRRVAGRGFRREVVREHAAVDEAGEDSDRRVGQRGDRLGALCLRVAQLTAVDDGGYPLVDQLGDPLGHLLRVQLDDLVRLRDRAQRRRADDGHRLDERTECRVLVDQPGVLAGRRVRDPDAALGEGRRHRLARCPEHVLRRLEARLVGVGDVPRCVDDEDRLGGADLLGDVLRRVGVERLAGGRRVERLARGVEPGRVEEPLRLDSRLLAQ